MLLAIDVHYKDNYSKSVGVLFIWPDKKPHSIITDTVTNVAPYESGQFYKRELPCILQLIKQIDLSVIKAIIVDGHVFVDNNKTFGLGGHLWQALDEKIPVIGIAKRAFHNTEQVSTPVFRGQSQNPLYVSSIGAPIETVLGNVKLLHGDNRIPTILKILDQHTKED